MNSAALRNVMYEMDQFTSDPVNSNNHYLGIIRSLVLLRRNFHEIGNLFLSHVVKPVKIVNNEMTRLLPIREAQYRGYVGRLSRRQILKSCMRKAFFQDLL